MRERAISYGLATGGFLGAATSFLHHAGPGGTWPAVVFGIGALVIAATFFRELAIRETTQLMGNLSARRP